jgi:hypothetical protein
MNKKNVERCVVGSKEKESQLASNRDLVTVPVESQKTIHFSGYATSR